MNRESIESCSNCHKTGGKKTAKEDMMEGTKYYSDKAKKSATDNQWTSSNEYSTEGTKYFSNKAEKTAGNNQWVSNNMAGEVTSK